MSSEEWKAINGIDNAYISSLGRVMSWTKKFGEKVLKPYISKRRKNSSPRLRVFLSRKTTQGRVFNVFVHTLVAKHFLPDSDCSKIVFRDKDTLNCRAENLAGLYDFNTVADHRTLQHYSKFKSVLGKACYQHCLLNKTPLEKEIGRWALSMPHMVTRRFNLSEVEVSEAYWLAATKFIQRVPLGFIENEDTSEGLLFTMMKNEAKYMAIRKYKFVSEFQGEEEYSFIDKVAHASLDGSSDVWCEEGISQYA